MSDAPVDPKYRAQLTAVARTIDEFLNGAERPKRIGFAVIMFELGAIEGGRINYMSNAERADMLTAVREWLARAEGRAHDPPSSRQ
jgi:hypothetical protein